jgi:hypothetical protein
MSSLHASLILGHSWMEKLSSPCLPLELVLCFNLFPLGMPNRNEMRFRGLL